MWLLNLNHTRDNPRKCLVTGGTYTGLGSQYLVGECLRRWRVSLLVERPGKEEFDQVLQKSVQTTLHIISNDCLASVISFISRGRADSGNLVSRLDHLDEALDALFPKFSRLIKHAIVLQACSSMKIEPPSLSGSLFWMIEELRASLWQVY